MWMMKRESFNAYFAAWVCIHAAMDPKDDMNAFSNAKGIVFW